MMLIGLIGLAFPFFTFRTSDDFVLLDALAKEKIEKERYQSQFIDSTISGLPNPTPDPNLPNIPNRLVIPQIDVDMPIFDGDSADILLKGGWIFPGTSTPGKSSGNTVIFGHRFRYLPPISNTFYALDKIKTGEKFKLSWNGNIYEYFVTDIRIIEPTDFSVLETTNEPTITLITCAPLFSTKQRLVIKASLVQQADIHSSP